jgi:TonB family protein
VLSLVLALMAAAAPAVAAPPTTTVSPVTVAPAAKPPPVDAKVEVGGDEDLIGPDVVAIWPADAYHTGVNGHVTLSCLVDTHGLAERCKVVSEFPAGKGLGRAALELRPTFKLEPNRGADGAAVSATMTIGVSFKAPILQFDLTAFLREAATARQNSTPGMGPFGSSSTRATGNPIPMRNVTMLDAPVWIAAASFDDVARAYPAKGGGVEGYAADHCHVRRDGTLDTCQTIKESPEGQGFGKAALTLAAKFRIDPAALARAPHSAPIWVDIPIRLPPREAAEHTVMAPSWIQMFDTHKALKVFPPEAVAEGLTTGRGVARCTVAADGTMTDCTPEAGQPDGLGFSEAAARLASTMKMNLWAADAEPVAGGVVHIPIRLNLKGAAAPNPAD